LADPGQAFLPDRKGDQPVQLRVTECLVQHPSARRSLVGRARPTRRRPYDVENRLANRSGCGRCQACRSDSRCCALTE
jgi:hypothetical protein